jgi:AcrR family transcriptional regulator
MNHSTSHGVAPIGERRARRRRETIEEALDHAVEVMAEHGVGGLTVSEMARRMGVRPPSLYKYFPSLHAVYDALFARGLTSLGATLEEAIAPTPPWGGGGRPPLRSPGGRLREETQEEIK